MRDRGAGRHRDQFGETAGPFDAHHAARPVIAAAVFGADIQRHDAGGGDAVAEPPSADPRADRIDGAGAIDAGNQRQHRAAAVSLPARRLTSSTRLTVAACTLMRISPGRGTGSGDVLVAQNLGWAVFVDDDGFHSLQAFIRVGGGLPGTT